MTELEFLTKCMDIISETDYYPNARAISLTLALRERYYYLKEVKNAAL